MTDRRWSLARRMNIGVAVTTVALVLAISGMSSWFLGQSIAREINALAHEELGEMKASLPAAGGTPEAFRCLAREFGDEHRGARMGWRLWDSMSGQTLEEFGPEDLVSLTEQADLPVGEMVALGEALRWGSTEIGSGQVVSLVLDGSGQLELLRRYQFLMVGMAGVAALLAILAGTLFCRNVSSALHDVAVRARAAHASSDPAGLTVKNAPEEIREVADAFSTMLVNIRKETGHLQLMAAGLAHELRSPIQNLMGETEVALMRERGAGEYRRVLESHVEELRDLGRVVDNLVSLCSPTGEIKRRASEHFDLAREADLRLERDRSDAARRDILLEIVCLGDLELQGDRESMLLALRNLVSNAIHWSPVGKTVRVQLEGLELEVVITVDDAGPGIPESEREEIFKPFHRGSAINGHRVGYGLGLALTRSAVEAHEGKITVGNSPEGGARFRIRIPSGDGADDVHKA